MGFTKLAKLKADETAVFSFIVYKSKAQRDQIAGYGDSHHIYIIHKGPARHESKHMVTVPILFAVNEDVLGSSPSRGAK